jgi:hypothetical protein
MGYHAGAWVPENYTLVSIDADVVLTAATVDDVPELHDRIFI